MQLCNGAMTATTATRRRRPQRQGPLLRRWTTMMLCGLLLFLCSSSSSPSSSLRGVRAWNSRLDDATYGICAWQKFAPDCVAPAACAKANDEQQQQQQTTDTNNKAVATRTTTGTDTGTGSRSSSTQPSPVTFTRAAIDAAVVLPEVCFARASPLVRVADKATGEAVMSVAPSARTSQMWLLLNGGGVLSTVCMDSAPLFVRAIPCKNEGSAVGDNDVVVDDINGSTKTSSNSSKDAATETRTQQQQQQAASKGEGADTRRRVHAALRTLLGQDAVGADDADDGPIWEVTQMLFYNGLMHMWPAVSEMTDTRSLREVELHLHRAQRAPAAADDDAATYQSRCVSVARTRAPPDLILSVTLQSTASAVTTRDVLLTIVSQLQAASGAVGKGDAFKVSLPQRMPLLVRGRRKYHSLYYAYNGSLAQPPCSGAGNIARIVLVQPILVPKELLASYDAISASKANNNGNTRLALLPTTQLHTGNFSCEGNKDYVDEKANDGGSTVTAATSTSSTATSTTALGNATLGGGTGGAAATTEPLVTAAQRAIALLTAINVLLLFYLVLLVLARYECVSLPTMFGGLNHPVQFYTRAYEELPALHNAGLRTAISPDTSSTSHPQTTSASTLSPATVMQQQQQPPSTLLSRAAY